MTYISEHIRCADRAVVIHSKHPPECKKDDEGNILWWFGGRPSGGVPRPAIFLESLGADCCPSFDPPWAVVAWSERDQTVSICTDRLGLKHIFVREVGTSLHVSPSAPLLAGLQKPRIDPIGLYQLTKCGNPQRGRTIFADVRCVTAATVLTIGSTVHSRQYWTPPEGEKTDPQEAAQLFSEAVQAAVVRQYRSGDVVEVTAGKDSLLVFAALKAAGVDFNAWTFGDPEDCDVLGAAQRCSRYAVPHEVLPLNWTDALAPEEAIELCRTWVAASSGMSDTLTYGILPKILGTICATGSMSGGAGESFRGFYYQSAAWGFPVPRAVRQLLLERKILAQEPFGSGVMRSEVCHLGKAALREDMAATIDLGPRFWHTLDCLYILSRMHSFGGGNMSATDTMMPVRVPFASAEVLNCLKYLPVEQRGARKSVVEIASEQLLRSVGGLSAVATNAVSKFRSPAGVIRKIAGQLKARTYTGRWQQFATAALTAPAAQDLLDLDRLASWGVFEESRLALLLKDISEGPRGTSVPISLGKILTAALAMEEAERHFSQTVSEARSVTLL